MGELKPILSNTMSNTCPEVIGTNCISWQGNAVPGTCSPASLTDVLNALQNCCTTNTNTLDLSTLDLGCLWNPVVSIWTCSCPNNVFVPDLTVHVGGAPGYCGLLGAPGMGVFVKGIGWIAAATTCTPTFVTVPNPSPKPTTLLGILQLIINNTPCCDPCSSSSSATTKP